MSKLSPLKPYEVIRRLRRLGFVGPIPGGQHVRMVRVETGQIIPVPMHKGRDVSVGIIQSIIREVGITSQAWNEL